MKNFTFIKERNTGNRFDVILAISNEIETLNLFETYDKFGQQIEHTNACDYAISNYEAKEAYNELISAIRDNFKISENVYFEIDTYSLESYELEKLNINPEELKKFIENWCKENEVHNTVKGFNYHNGQNWQTVVTNSDFSEPSHDIVTENNDLMNQEIEDSIFVEESHGKRYYESENYFIIQSAWQGDFESYQLYDKKNIESIEDLK